MDSPQPSFELFRCTDPAAEPPLKAAAAESPLKAPERLQLLKHLKEQMEQLEQKEPKDLETCKDNMKWLPTPPWRPGLDKTQLETLMPLATDRELWEQLLSNADPAGLETSRGAVFSLPEDRHQDGVTLGDQVRLAVNAAIHLRRPLLVSGDPGTGKTSLAYAIAWQLGLGPVLSWPITPRSRLREDGLYGYDAIGRLYATQIRAAGGEATANSQKPAPPVNIGDYIKLGPVGTAFIPSRWPRVLLIDEIDKADLQLPNELLHLFEEGQYTIEELRREGGDTSPEGGATSPEEVKTCDDRRVPIHGGQVRCHEFPIVVMTSNRERDFPPAFHRRCLRIDMPRPTHTSLAQLVKRHFRGPGVQWDPSHDDLLDTWIRDFLIGGNNPDRAIDQLLNAVYLLTQTSADQLQEASVRQLRQILQRRLSESA